MKEEEFHKMGGKLLESMKKSGGKGKTIQKQELKSRSEEKNEEKNNIKNIQTCKKCESNNCEQSVLGSCVAK